MKKTITTKKGDKGKTNLYGKKRVDKDDPRVEAFGSIDELSSYLGLLKSQEKRREVKNIIETIQKDLLFVGSEIAIGVKFKEKIAKKITKKEISKLEGLIRDFEQRVVLKKEFYLPGENFQSAVIDIARTIVRKAERRVVVLGKKELLKNSDILIYLNRLSDLFFLLARYSETG